MTVTSNADKRVAQIIDANLDRAREGLRVVEDWTRFGLNQKDLVIQIKDFRQQLGKLHLELYKEARSTLTDQGINLSHPYQNERVKPEEIISANCARIQEALRVIEEFSRTSHNVLAKTASKIRYELYNLEIVILNATKGKKRKDRLKECNLCLITKPSPKLKEIVELALKSGLKMLQYRCKEGSDKEKMKEAKDLASLCNKYDSLFIINDRIDIAIATNADGVHLGQDDIPIDSARKILGPNKIIGLSTHSIEQIVKANQEICDYVGIGPVFNTSSKPQATALGIEYLKKGVNSTDLPAFAIGGINISNISNIELSGTTKVAVISAIMGATDPAAATTSLLRGEE